MQLAITNLKGGTGKTTTAVHLAAGLSVHGRTLLIDADEQRSATAWADLIGPLCPFDVVADSGADMHVRLERLMRGYAHVVIDAPPHDVGVVRSAVLSASDILIPLTPSAMDINRLWPMIELATSATSRVSPSVRVLLTKVRPHTKTLRMARETLDEMGIPVVDTSIPQRESYRTAFGQLPSTETAYRDVLIELLNLEVAA
ncbi:MAG: nucleotide-binding protein [Acidimicrobiales bacterium]